jgi:hypothetical protein
MSEFGCASCIYLAPTPTCSHTVQAGLDNGRDRFDFGSKFLLDFVPAKHTGGQTTAAGSNVDTATYKFKRSSYVMRFTAKPRWPKRPDLPTCTRAHDISTVQHLRWHALDLPCAGRSRSSWGSRS